MSNPTAIRAETRGNLTVHVCADCGRWSHEGQAIVHSKRCDTSTAQPTITDLSTTSARKAASKAAEVARLARAGEVSHAGLTEDEIVDAVGHGVISVSDAMNRDF